MLEKAEGYWKKESRCWEWRLVQDPLVTVFFFFGSLIFDPFIGFTHVSS